ncbi:hybrid sensor histidine kinase/response regulator [Geomesophilobacter sediminis]|uniref:histidine kinase n=1 Tax=Geomesophilobacter sediminis TaxID=2798584 RepID=A0A8J7JE15_9BACT|nr:hybrid sensor histidine kinase/response regulator [Geomesophilobacter sediminis]MBJ6725603.1 response regulator [Geomesophilobacter sediminis]
MQLTQQADLSQRLERETKTILIVDDESVIRDLCARALHDYNTVQAGDGDEALRIFERGGIDVILTDVMMPKVNGIELLRKLKEREPTLVVLIMTGYADKEIILNALKEDADDFITKPLNLLQLRSAVEKALVKKALKEEIANLKNLDRLKNSFLSLISHKLRTPITVISLFMQNLASGVYDPDSPTDRENLRLVSDEACYLGSLVTDLLAFSKVMDTERELRREPCDLAAMIPELVKHVAERGVKPSVKGTWNIEQVPPLLLDRELIMFALEQVVDNAVKFSREGGTYLITVSNQGASCQITVEDHGIGMDKEEIPKVFEKFYQVDAEKAGQIRGFGLGLFYAREFVRKHGGSINIESEAGIGTRVVIDLPTSVEGAS